MGDRDQETAALDRLAVQVAALRDDVNSYRDALDARSRRRFVAMAATLAVVVAIGAGALLAVERAADRHREVIEQTQEHTCQAVRRLQSVLVSILADAALVAEQQGSPPERLAYLEAATEALSGDPCLAE